VEVVKKVYTLLSTVKWERTALAAEMENVPIFWVSDQYWRREFLSLKDIETHVKFPILLCLIWGNNIDNFYFSLSVMVVLECISPNIILCLWEIGISILKFRFTDPLQECNCS
jgi:hypothetical protein